jgi:HlyD family secretion protein
LWVVFGTDASYILTNEVMSKSETNRRSPYALVGVLIGAAALAVLAVRSCSRDVIEVHVASASYDSVIQEVPANGKVEPVGEFQAHAPAPGVVDKLYVNAGDKVRAGDLLVQMRDPDATAKVATATSAVRAAELALQDMQRNGTTDELIGMQGDLARTKQQVQDAQSSVTALQQLQQKGAASTSEVTAAQQRLATATSSLQTLEHRSAGRYSPADLARAKAQLADAHAGLAAAETGYASANIRSPISGTVYSVPVSEYDFVHDGDDLLDVADLNRIEITGYFDEPEIGKLAAGQPVKIVWDAKPDRVWHGHVKLAPTAVVSYGTRNVGECLITVDDANGDLLPNTNVTVTVTTQVRHNVLSVPREALHPEGPSAFYVYRVSNGRLVRVTVQVGLVNLTRAEITGGLTDKDQVVVSTVTPHDLSSGLAVKIVP